MARDSGAEEQTSNEAPQEDRASLEDGHLTSPVFRHQFVLHHGHPGHCLVTLKCILYITTGRQVDLRASCSFLSVRYADADHVYERSLLPRPVVAS